MGISVVLGEIEGNSSELKEISVFKILDKFSLIKSISLDGSHISNGFRSDLIKTLSNLRTTNSLKLNKILSSENVSKSLSAIYNNKSFVINHISNKNDNLKKKYDYHRKN